MLITSDRVLLLVQPINSDIMLLIIIQNLVTVCILECVDVSDNMPKFLAFNCWP